MNAVTSSVQFLGQEVDVGTLPAERHEEFLQLLNEFKDVFSVPGDTTRRPAKSEFKQALARHQITALLGDMARHRRKRRVKKMAVVIGFVLHDAGRRSSAYRRRNCFFNMHFNT